jgi:hypothetical protein
VEETVNSSCECEKGCQLYELLLMPCAVVQQLPHVRRGACDLTGGVGGRDVWFHSVTVGGSVFNLRNKLNIIWKVVNCFLQIKFFLNFTLSFDENKLIFVKQNGQFHKN